jgi:dihydrofolate synthase/folylpolyglutamate synthase
MPVRPVRTSQPWSDHPTAAAYLAGLTGYESTGVIAEPSTRRIEAITAALGSPNRRYPAVHITGTNGKGSTTALTTSVLRANGLRVGTYTSPHLTAVVERISVDGKPIAAEQFAEALGQVAWASERVGATPSWFEAVTAAGFVVFAEAAVDVAVVEVGMLGRWDATNILDSTVAVVTNVELDHTEMAGPSRAHIAAEKAGIIHPEVTLVLGETDPQLLPIFVAQGPRQILQLGVELTVSHRVCTPQGSIVTLSTPWRTHEAVPVGMLGEHQCANAVLALAAAESFLGRALNSATVRSAFAATRLAGRAELLTGAGPRILVDGAHNRAGARSLRATVDEYFGDIRPRVLVCASSGSRDPGEFIEGVGGGDFDLIVATEVSAARRVSAETVAQAARRSGAPTVAVVDPGRALEHALGAAGPAGLVVVAGSLYLAGPARLALGPTGTE